MKQLVAVVVAGMLAVVGLVAAAAHAFTGTEEQLGVEAGPAYDAPVDRTAEQLEGIARGCASAGHQVDAGVQEGVWLVRCRPAGRPAHLESLGVVPVAAGRR